MNNNCLYCYAAPNLAIDQYKELCDEAVITTLNCQTKQIEQIKGEQDIIVKGGIEKTKAYLKPIPKLV